jgi:hypothetical protein
VISIIWLWGTLFVAGFFPIIDGRYRILLTFKAPRKRGGSGRNKQTDTLERDITGINSSEDSTAVSFSAPFPEK